MLEQEIQSDIDERQKQMLQIKTFYLRNKLNKKDEQLFLIYSISAVYAIWEGFVDTAFRTYIQELNKLNLTVDTVCESILIHHIESEFKQFKEYPDKPEKKIALFNGLNRFYTNKTIEIKAAISTKSNVKFKVLNDILDTFNLERISPYIESGRSLKQELDDLVIARNAVAHGQPIIEKKVKPKDDLENRRDESKREDLNDSIKLVNILMELVLEKIMQGFVDKSYLKTEKISFTG